MIERAGQDRVMGPVSVYEWWGYAARCGNSPITGDYGGDGLAHAPLRNVTSENNELS